MPSSETTARWRGWLAPRGFAVLLAGLVLVSFWKVFLGLGTFVLGDFNLFGFPLAHHAKRSLLAGEIPLWNPLSNCGLPFLAQWNTMVLYPPAWLHLVFPLSWWLGVFCLLHLYVGGLGMYALARCGTGSDLAGAVAGVAWGFGGLVQSALMWPNNSVALGLLPWVLLMAGDGMRRGGRALIQAVLIGALQMLAGAPEIVIFTWLLVVFEWLVRPRDESVRVVVMIRRGVFMVTAIALVCAAQLLPFLDLLWHSQRGEEYLGPAWAAGPFVWANYLVPLFRTVGTSAGVYYQSGQFWLVSSYAGIGTLLLALIAVAGGGRVDRWRMLLVLVSLVLAMGDAGYVYSLLKQVLPLGVMRYPAKFLVPVSVVLPLLAAAGVARFERRVDGRGLAQGAAVVVALLGLMLALIEPLNVAGEPSGPVWWSALERSGFLGLTVWCLHAMQRWRFAVVALLLLIWGDLRTQQSDLTPTVSRSVYDDASPLPQMVEGRTMLSAQALAELRQKSLPSHADTAVLQRLSLFDNLNLPDGIAKVDGFWSLYLPEQQQVEGLVYDGWTGFRKPLADLCGAVRVTSPTNIFAWQTRDAMPWVTGGQEVVPVPREEIMARLADPEFDPRREVFIAPEELPTGVMAVAGVDVLDLEVSPHEWRFMVESPTNAIVVVSQAHYPNWRAEVNGEATAIYRANHAFQAVVVSAGGSEVRLVYRDRMFQVGVGVSLASLLALGWLWWRPGVSDRRNRAPNPSGE